MLKFLGIALLLSGTAGIGFGKARELDQRVEELRMLRQLIMLLEGEIRCTHRPLPELLISLGERFGPPFQSFLVETGKELEAKLAGTDIPAAEVMGIAESLQDPQLLARDMVLTVKDPVLGDIQLVGDPMKLSENPVRTDVPSPTLGQDTKAIGLAGGKVRKFVMNDKCSAGTGRFLEIMADRLGVSQAELARLAAAGQPTVISNKCTVFAESEVITLVGKGEPRENIARGVIDSVVAHVCTLVGQVPAAQYHLTGGLCDNEYVRARLEAELGAPVGSCPDARFAGALGAAIIAAEIAGEA